MLKRLIGPGPRFRSPHSDSAASRSGRPSGMKFWTRRIVLSAAPTPSGDGKPKTSEGLTDPETGEDREPLLLLGNVHTCPEGFLAPRTLDLLTSMPSGRRISVEPPPLQPPEALARAIS